MSGITTTQSAIAADLDAYDSAMWFTGAYLISMSSVSPLAGRLAMIFSPAVMVLLSSLCFAVGAVATAVAPSLAVFLVGRVLEGIGSGGIMTLCMIFVIQLTSKKRRGLWIGLTNAVSISFPYRCPCSTATSQANTHLRVSLSACRPAPWCLVPWYLYSAG